MAPQISHNVMITDMPFHFSFIPLPLLLLLTPCYLFLSILLSPLVPDQLYTFGPEGCMILHPRIPVLGLTHAICVVVCLSLAVHELYIYT